MLDEDAKAKANQRTFWTIPSLKALHGIPAWALFYLASSKYNFVRKPHQNAIIVCKPCICHVSVWSKSATSTLIIELNINL